MENRSPILCHPIKEEMLLSTREMILAQITSMSHIQYNSQKMKMERDEVLFKLSYECFFTFSNLAKVWVKLELRQTKNWVEYSKSHHFSTTHLFQLIYFRKFTGNETYSAWHIFQLVKNCRLETPSNDLKHS